MSAPSAKARAIAEAWIPKKDDFSPFEGVPVIGPAVRRELAALIDAHLKDVREAMNCCAEVLSGESMSKSSLVRALELTCVAIKSLTPEDRE